MLGEFNNQFSKDEDIIKDYTKQFGEFKDKSFTKEIKKIIFKFGSFLENILKKHSLETIIHEEFEKSINEFFPSKLKDLSSFYLAKYKLSIHDIIDIHKGFVKYDLKKIFDKVKFIKQEIVKKFSKCLEPLENIMKNDIDNCFKFFHCKLSNIEQNNCKEFLCKINNYVLNLGSKIFNYIQDLIFNLESDYANLINHKYLKYLSKIINIKNKLDEIQDFEKEKLQKIYEYGITNLNNSTKRSLKLILPHLNEILTYSDINKHGPSLKIFFESTKIINNLIKFEEIPHKVINNYHPHSFKSNQSNNYISLESLCELEKKITKLHEEYGSYLITDILKHIERNSN